MSYPKTQYVLAKTKGTKTTFHYFTKFSEAKQWMTSCGDYRIAKLSTSKWRKLSQRG